MYVTETLRGWTLYIEKMPTFMTSTCAVVLPRKIAGRKMNQNKMTLINTLACPKQCRVANPS